ncbi:MAG TPA: MerR family transcriptional regulator [Pseudonocardiaceae bacterium]|jgi:DNA-binding transcriptional MerR regulator|nr:MerR family transcriptional regulator [Pseudonocardiaceae bacterium]
MVDTVERLTIGQVAERTELSVHALRFYEREGLFANPVRRDSAGRRVYDESDLEWLNICSRLRASGMPLRAIREYVELVRAGAGNELARLNLLREHQERVAARMRELAECYELISCKVTIYEQHVADGDADRLWNPERPD